ncbi:hypothetical protein BHE74_00005838 [Ensete ventricosum]|nr:hypothetical protein BHE74_00005838 [Ensete ventricosum]
MSSAFSHSESHTVEMSTRKSRVLSHPSGDSRSSALAYVSEGVALVDPGTTDALVAMQSNFDVDSTVTTHRLIEVRKNYFIPPEYELYAPLPGERPYDAFPNSFSLSTDALKAGLRFPLHPMIETSSKGGGFRLLRWRPTCYTLRELCEVKDRMGAERYFATIVTRLKVAKGEDPLMLRWSAIAGSSQFWTEGPLSGEYLYGALHPTLVKQAYECSSEELMNRASKSAIWVHDASRLVRSQHERILALRATKELKGRADQDLVAIVEFHVKELEGDVNKLRGELESLKTHEKGSRRKSGFCDPAWMGLGMTELI